MKVNIEEIYTSVACNRIPEIVDWNNGGIVCFGATNAVVIYDTVCFYSYYFIAAITARGVVALI